MRKTKTSTEVKDRYNKKAYDTIWVRVKKGNKKVIEEAVKEFDPDMSLNSFVVEAIEEKIFETKLKRLKAEHERAAL